MNHVSRRENLSGSGPAEKAEAPPRRTLCTQESCLTTNPQLLVPPQCTGQLGFQLLTNFLLVVPCIIQYDMWLLAAKLSATTLEARFFLYDENHVTFRQLAGHQICFRIWFFFRTWQWLCWLSGKIKFPSNRVKEVERASPKAKVKTHSGVLLKSLPSFFANTTVFSVRRRNVLNVNITTFPFCSW